MMTDERMSVMERIQKLLDTDLVLADRNKEVQDLYQEAPKGKAISVHDRKTDAFGRNSGIKAGDNADLGSSRLGNKKELQ